MENLATRVVKARDLAAAREPDLRIRALIADMKFLTRPGADVPESVSVMCHQRSWYKFFGDTEGAELEALCDDELAGRLVEWIQGALQINMLALSDPPMPRGAAG